MAEKVRCLDAAFVELVRAHRLSQGLGGQCTPEQLAEVNAAFDRELRRREGVVHAPVSPNRADRGNR